MSRPARALVDARALRHNLGRVRAAAPRSRVMAVVKANAYGHGLAWAARSLAGVDAFAVASVEEGIELRDAGVTAPVCLLGGFHGADELPELARYGFEPAIHEAGQLELLARAAGARVTVWVKVDTGMHRLGFPPATLPGVLETLRHSRVVGDVRVMSHLANADVPDDPACAVQIDSFLEIARGCGLETSLANSAGVLAWPASHLDCVRPGIMLYGASPFADRRAADLDLRPVMTLTSALIAVAPRHRGERIGYGGDWVCPEDMPVGVVAIGYGDGYPRHAPSGTPALVNGHRVPLIGRVSMDLITLDLRDEPRARVGDPVVLWGKGLPVEEVAAMAGTISYELLCRVAERVPRVIIDGGPGAARTD